MDDRPVQFFVPVPPSANDLFANVPGKGRVRTEKYRSWATTAGWMIKSQNINHQVPGLGWSVAIEARINHSRDLDNILKPTLDLLVALRLIGDDRYVDQITLSRANPEKPAEIAEKHMRVTITPLVG